MQQHFHAEPATLCPAVPHPAHRFMIELVLATDMKQHFPTITRFKAVHREVASEGGAPAKQPAHAMHGKDGEALMMSSAASTSQVPASTEGATSAGGMDGGRSSGGAKEGPAAVLGNRCVAGQSRELQGHNAVHLPSPRASMQACRRCVLFVAAIGLVSFGVGVDWWGVISKGYGDCAGTMTSVALATR